MKTGTLTLLSALTLVLSALLLSGARTAATVKDRVPRASAAATQSQKRVYERASYTESVYGTISFHGKVPERRMIDMAADPVCDEINRSPQTGDVIVTDGKLANVFVYVKTERALEEFSFEAPSQSAVLEHKKCQYVPHALGIQVGQTLSVVNGDPTTHNTNVQTIINRPWNVSQPPGGEPILKQFSLAEMFIPFKDNQHPWEKAWVGVFAHPFFAVSKRDGSYRIDGLPPGSYTLVAWHEKYGEQQIAIAVAQGEQKTQDFIFESHDGR
jgi:plastocyanin